MAVGIDPSAEGFGRRRAQRHDGGFDVAGDVGEGERRNGRDARKHGKGSMSPMGRNQQHRTGRTRGRRIFIRVSDQEFEEIRAAADMKGVRLALPGRGARDVHRPRSREKEMRDGPIVEKLEAIRTEIWHIGHNVNQIARNTNRDMSASMDDEHSAAKAVRDCRACSSKPPTPSNACRIRLAAEPFASRMEWMPSIKSGSRGAGRWTKKTKGLGISAKAFADRALPIHVDDYMSVRSRSQARRRRKRRAPSYHCWNVSSGRGHDGLDQTVYRNEQARSGKTQRELQTDT